MINPTIILLAGFAAPALAVIALAMVFSDVCLFRRAQVDARLCEEFGSETEKDPQKPHLFKDLQRLQSARNGTRAALGVRFGNFLKQSGLPITAGGVLSLSLLFGIGGAAIAVAAGGQIWQWVIAALLAACVPLAAVWHRRSQRIGTLRGQLPEAFELMSQAIRAGQTVTAAFQSVAENCERPISDEFTYCRDQLGLGLPQEVALGDLANRTGIIEAQMFVVAMVVQRQVGGSPVEVLNNLSAVVRKRSKLQGKIKALTAEGRMQALVLLLLPPVVMGILAVVNRSHVEALFAQPNLLCAMGLLELLGAACIHKITNFDY